MLHARRRAARADRPRCTHLTLYGVFRAATADVVIAAQIDPAWRRFATLIEQTGGAGAGFAEDERFHNTHGRNRHRGEILAVAVRG